MKIVRQLDGKTYDVRGEDETRYLILHPADGGEMWIQKRYSDPIPEQSEAETYAKATGSVGARVIHDRREIDGSLTTISDETYVRPEPPFPLEADVEAELDGRWVPCTIYRADAGPGKVEVRVNFTGRVLTVDLGSVRDSGPAQVGFRAIQQGLDKFHGR